MQIYLTGVKPIFEEIRDSIRLYIEKGILKPGERLPSVRELALSLFVNPNTVMRAYQELTDEGLLSAIPKKGLYVAEKKMKPEGDETIVNALNGILEKGYTLDEIQNTLRKMKEGKDD